MPAPPVQESANCNSQKNELMPAPPIRKVPTAALNTGKNFDALAGTRTRTSRLPVWCAIHYTTTPKCSQSEDMKTLRCYCTSERSCTQLTRATPAEATLSTPMALPLPPPHRHSRIVVVSLGIQVSPYPSPHHVVPGSQACHPPNQ